MDRGDLDLLGVVRFGLERIDLVRFLQRVQRQFTEALLEHGRAALDRR